MSDTGDADSRRSSAASQASSGHANSDTEDVPRRERRGGGGGDSMPPPPLMRGGRRASLLTVRQERESAVFVHGQTNKLVEDFTERRNIQSYSDVIRTQDHLNLEHMQSLMRSFMDHGGALNFEEFCGVLKEIVGPSERFGKQMSFLFAKADTNADSKVDWDEFCSYLLQDLSDKEGRRSEREVPLMVCPQLFETPHKSTIRRILHIPNPSRLITASEDGAVCFWNMKMRMTRSFHLGSGQGPKNLKLTDIVYMPNAFRFAVATTNRDLCFFDSATSVLCNRLIGLGDIITSMDYHIHPSDPDKAWLTFGDMGGYVNVLAFNSATTQLFNEAYNPWDDGINIHTNSVDKAPKGSALPSVVKLTRVYVHSGDGEEVDKSVKLIRILPSINMLLSCAGTPTKALTLRSLDAVDGGADFNIPKGVATFDYSEKWNLIATGGADCQVRLWNPYVPTHPTANLKGHATPVTHVAFNNSYGQVISLSVNEIINIWDIKDQVCLNTLAGLIPHRPTQSKHTVMSLLWHEGTQSLLTTTRDELAVIQMTRDEQIKAAQTSHDFPISSALYSEKFNLFITADSLGQITTWDLGSGEKILSWEAHPSAVVSAMCLGCNGKRLISAGSDGSIYVWNLLSGMCLQKLLHKGTKEVTGVIVAQDRIFSVGWDRRLVSYLDSRSIDLSKLPNPIPEDSGWSPTTQHRDDVLTFDYCPQSLAATGSYDGQIMIWNLQTARLMNKFDVRTALKLAESAEAEETPLVVPNVGGRATVEKLLWLRRRALDAENNRAAATLVATGDSGYVYFWNALKGQLMGAFHAAHTELSNEAITAISTDSQNRFLVTADSLGYCKLWGIDDFCMDLEKRRERPRLVASWRAHIQAVSTVTLVEESRVVVTGSVDCSVRVWTMSSEYVGTFGDKNKWVLASEPTGSSIALGVARKKPDDVLAEERRREAEEIQIAERRASEMPQSDAFAKALEDSRRENQLHRGLLGIVDDDDHDDEYDDEDEDELLEGGGGDAADLDSQAAAARRASRRASKARRSSSAQGGGSKDRRRSSKAPADAVAKAESRPKENDKDSARSGGGVKLPPIKGAMPIRDGDLSSASSDELMATARKVRELQLTPSQDSVLGFAYSKRAAIRQQEKQHFRTQKAPTDVSKVNQQGFLFCQPFQALQWTPLEVVPSHREPSAAVRSRRQKAALWEELEEVRTPKPRGKGKVKHATFESGS